MVSKFQKGFLAKMAFELGFKEHVELRTSNGQLCKKSGGKARGRKSQHGVHRLKERGYKRRGGAEMERAGRPDGRPAFLWRP